MQAQLSNGTEHIGSGQQKQNKIKKNICWFRCRTSGLKYNCVCCLLLLMNKFLTYTIAHCIYIVCVRLLRNEMCKVHSRQVISDVGLAEYYVHSTHTHIIWTQSIREEPYLLRTTQRITQNAWFWRNNCGYLCSIFPYAATKNCRKK